MKPHGLELSFHLFKDILQPFNILINAFQSAQCLGLFYLEPADASGLVKNIPSILWRGLKQTVHLALFNDAVGIGSGTTTQEQIADILQTASLTVDQVFTFTITTYPASYLKFGGIGVENLAGVIKDEGNFRIGRRLSGGGPVKNDIGHLAATKTSGALFTQNPADGVHDVAFARTIGPDNRAYAVG